MANQGPEEVMNNRPILKNNTSAFTRDLFKGGNQVTEEIQRQLHIDFDEAEKIKIGSKNDPSSQSVIENVLKDVSDALAVEIGNSLDFFQSSTTYEKISKLYLGGGGSKIKDFDILLQQHIGIPVEIINPFKKIEFGGKGLDMEYLREIGPAMAVGVGLASRKVGDR